jgi:hypothetical protein
MATETIATQTIEFENIAGEQEYIPTTIVENTLIIDPAVKDGMRLYIFQAYYVELTSRNIVIESQGNDIVSAEHYGNSAWATTFRITAKNGYGITHDYFVKVTSTTYLGVSRS